MNFELTQEEINRLQFCKEQMVFISDLCCMAEGNHPITIEGLGSFLTAQVEILQATIKVAEERESAQRVLNQAAAAAIVNKPATMAMTADLLVRIMEVCSGGVRDEKAAMELHNELYDATVPYGEAAPLKALYLALRRQGFDINSTSVNGVSTFTIKQAKTKKAAHSPAAPAGTARKRDKLVAA